MTGTRTVGVRGRSCQARRVLKALKDGLRDAADIVRHVRGPREAIQALLPASMRERRVLNDAPGHVTGDHQPRQNQRQPACNLLHAVNLA